MASFEYENYNITSKLSKSIECKNEETKLCDMLASVGVFYDVVQKASNVIEVQQLQSQTQNVEPSKMFEDNTDNISSIKTIPTNLDVETYRLGSSTDVICTEEMVCKVTNNLTDHNNLIDFKIQDQIKTVKNTKNNKKYKKQINNKQKKCILCFFLQKKTHKQ